MILSLDFQSRFSTPAVVVFSRFSPRLAPFFEANTHLKGNSTFYGVQVSADVIIQKFSGFLRTSGEVWPFWAFLFRVF